MSIYDQIGGAFSVSTAVDRFYDKVLADPSLRGYFSGKDLTRIKSHQRAFLRVALGGPDGYSGRELAVAHAGLGVTSGAFYAVLRHLTATLTELQVPPDLTRAIVGKLSPLASEVVSGS